jgi:hypothetical protein
MFALVVFIFIVVAAAISKNYDNEKPAIVLPNCRGKK